VTKQPSILYVGAFRFPEGDAAAARVLGVAKALREAGHEIVFVPNLSQDRPDDRLPSGGYGYQGFQYVPAPCMAQNTLARLQRLWRTHLTGRTVMERIRKLDLSSLQAVIVYHGCAPLLLALRAFCRRRRVALIADCTEWYDPWHVTGGPLGPFRWDCELRLRWLQKRTDGIIVISSYLQDYYQSTGLPVICVPPLVDPAERKWTFPPSPAGSTNVLRLVYGGTPGRKDLIGNAIRALPRLRREGIPVVVKLLGPSRAAVEELLGGEARILQDLTGAIECPGRIPQHDVPQQLATADFSILLRPNQRFAQAGFPTKLVESLAAGVPVLANPTSDIAQYVRDEQEGLLLQDGTPHAFQDGIRRVWRLPRDRWHAMRAAARRCADVAFDYRRHVVRLDGFVRDAIGRQRGDN
jgi:glycosyltransferase involved in cell wall biosynthesis